MMIHRIISSIALGLTLSACMSVSAQKSISPGSPHAAETTESVIERYAPGSIISTEIADRALDDVRNQRAFVEGQFTQDEAVCHKKFFVTSCMDAAKDRRRMALKQLGAIEVEANARIRRAGVEQKDQALRERQVKKETSAVDKADMPNSGAQNEAPPTAQDISEVESRSRQSAPASPQAQTSPADRPAVQAEDPAQARAKEAAEAEKRAENIRAFEKKQQRSLERQRKIAEKKREKEQKLQQKQEQ
ncbi:MAG: hypothetical protein ACO1NO_09490 [Burkholderiaceae bacterium]